MDPSMESDFDNIGLWEDALKQKEKDRAAQQTTKKKHGLFKKKDLSRAESSLAVTDTAQHPHTIKKPVQTTLTKYNNKFQPA